MALIPKSAVIQIRLSPDLLARFQAVCDAKDATISEDLRRYIHREVDAYERFVEASRLKAASGSPVPAGALTGSPYVAPPPSPVVTPANHQNRVQRKAAERDAKQEAKLDKKRGV